MRQHGRKEEEKPIDPTCKLCNLGHPEDVLHFLLSCPAYEAERATLQTDLESAPATFIEKWKTAGIPHWTQWFLQLPITDNEMDPEETQATQKHFVTFIRSAWKRRNSLMQADKGPDRRSGKPQQAA